MKKRMLLFLVVCIACSCFAGCQEGGDAVQINNKSSTVYDNVIIEIKDGYFYKEHEKFTVDDNTVGVTIYFSTEEGMWN